jgi:hypothetical protein
LDCDDRNLGFRGAVRLPSSLTPKALNLQPFCDFTRDYKRVAERGGKVADQNMYGGV